VSGFTIDELMHGGIGDHMRVGPQWIEPSNRGMPVIQRGPHGMRFGPDPMRANGQLHWWRESVSDVPYRTGQAVVGIMGMGALGGEASDEIKDRLTKEAKAQSKQVEETYNTYELRTLIRLADERMAEVSGYRQFQAGWSGLPIVGKSWWSSTKIRGESYATKQRALAKLQASEGIEIKTASGTRAPRTLEEQREHQARTISARPPEYDQSRAQVAAEYFPQAVIEQSRSVVEAARRATQEAEHGAAKTALGIGALALVGVGVYAYFSSKGRGPTIQIGS
jgi:hypothetical protein